MVTPAGPNAVFLQFRYLAILGSTHEQIAVEINPSRVDGPDIKVLNATKELWEWMVSKNRKEKVSLEEVYELAKKMSTPG